MRLRLESDDGVVEIEDRRVSYSPDVLNDWVRQAALAMGVMHQQAAITGDE